MDDGSRITIFNSSHPDGTVVPGSYVRLGGTGTTDLKDLLVEGRNRAVITQVDDCPVGNQLQSAEVELNGQIIEVNEPPADTSPIVPSAYGDVHIRTPDGLVYDFQEVGEFLLTQSASGDVMVQARQENWENNPRVSINTAAAMSVGGDKLEFYLKPERRFYINDELTDLPSRDLQLPQGGSIVINPSGNASRQDFTILWPDGNTGARVILFSDSHIDIGVARLNGSLTYEGVLGNLDNNAQNDMQIRDGDQLAPLASFDQLKSFGDSWRVPAGESLFRDGNADQAVASERPLTLLDLDVAERAAAEQACQDAGVSDQLALGNCTYDVAVTGDETFIESAKVFEEATEEVPASAKVPGDVASKVAIQGTVFPLAGRFDFQVGTKYPSESGNHYLIFQEDGNLVVYTAADAYVWGIQDSGKEWARNTRAVMQEDGNLVTYDDQEPIWATDTYGNAGAELTLNPAGALQIVHPNGEILWSSQ